jgi:hypothetical protein
VEGETNTQEVSPMNITDFGILVNVRKLTFFSVIWMPYVHWHSTQATYVSRRVEMIAQSKSGGWMSIVLLRPRTFF